MIIFSLSDVSISKLIIPVDGIHIKKHLILDITVDSREQEAKVFF